MSDLARKLAAHPRFGWKPGMVTATGHAISQDDLDDEFSPAGVRPDIHHPATKGWLLAMLREATGIPDLGAERLIGMWSVIDDDDNYGTEGEALAAALLLAWGTP